MTNLLRKPWLRYLLVGGTAYLCEMATLVLMRRELGFSPVRAVAISFWVGFVIAFALQKLITFQNYDRALKSMLRQLTIYSALVAWNYVFTLVAVKLLEGTTNVYVIRTVTIIIITSWNYAVYKQIFRSGVHEQTNK